MTVKPIHPTAAGLAAAALVLAGAAGAQEAGDAERGADLFSQCQACHQVGANAENAVGPHLNHVFGRTAGTIEGATYSPAMMQAGQDGLEWDAESISAYIADPEGFLPGTSKTYEGMPDAQDRADLIAYLRLFDVPVEEMPEPRSSDIPQPDFEIDPAILLLTGDPEYGAGLAEQCVTCHAEGDAATAPPIRGWKETDFVIAMHAYRKGARDHEEMRQIAEDLEATDIAALAAYFATR